jgi:hypothetical protein
VTVIVAAVTLGSCGDGDAAVSTTTSRRSSTTELTTTTPPPTTTTTPTTTSSPSTTEGVALPAPSHIVARPGGGSGEVELEWSAVTGATGYQILRAGASSGPFETAATIDLETGGATKDDGVVNVWSDLHSYVPSRGRLTGPDTSDRFRLVDVGAGARCFQVRAMRAGQPGSTSATACAAPV